MSLDGFLTTHVAAKRARISIPTMHHWCKHYRTGEAGIAVKLRGRWMIDPHKLGLLLAGRELKLWNLLKEESIKIVREDEKEEADKEAIQSDQRSI